MTDRIVKVLENGRFVCRGFRKVRGLPCISLDDDESLPITVDWSDWLQSDTISSVTNDATSVTVSSASNTTTTATMTLSANSSGYVEHRITTAAGSIKELVILVSGSSDSRQYDYGFAR